MCMCISVCAFNKYAFKIIFIFCNINYIQQTNECNTYMHAYYIFRYIYKYKQSEKEKEGVYRRCVAYLCK